MYMSVGPWVIGGLVEGRNGAIFAWVWMIIVMMLMVMQSVMVMRILGNMYYLIGSGDV